MARFIDELKRTHSCGELREENIGQEVVLFGWVQSRRDHGGCIFIDLRDREGLTQIVFDPETGATEAFEAADRARSEWVLGVRGEVRDRGTKDDGTSLHNPRLATGAIEVIAAEANDSLVFGAIGSGRGLHGRAQHLAYPGAARESLLLTVLSRLGDHVDA